MASTKRVGKGGTQKYDVEKKGVEKFVMDKYKEGVPATKISQELKHEKDVDITPLSINRWLRKVKEKDLAKTSENNVEEFKEVALDYKREIYEILDEVKEMKKYAKDEKHIDGYVKLVGKLYQGLELIAKIMGDMKQSQGVDVNVVINKITENEQQRNTAKRSGLFDNDVFDVEAEVIDEDKSAKE